MMNGDETPPTETNTATATPETEPAAQPAAEAKPVAEAKSAEASADAAEANAEATEEQPKAEPQATPVGGIADALRRAFNGYLEESGARDQYGDEVNIDLDFLKDHAGPMFSSMFQQLTSSIIPKDLKVGVPGTTATGQPGEKPVSVNFDLGGILSSFFSQKKPTAANDTPPAAAPKAEATPEAAPKAEATPEPKPDTE